MGDVISFIFNLLHLILFWCGTSLFNNFDALICSGFYISRKSSYVIEWGSKDS